MNDDQVIVMHGPDEEVVQPILDGIQRYGLEAIGGNEPKKLAVLFRSLEGVVTGGGIGQEIRGMFYLSHLWVTAEQRGQGLGGHLLGVLEQEAVALGCSEVRLDTLNARALPFYLRHGYEAYARIPEYIPGFERVFFRKAKRAI